MKQGRELDSKTTVYKKSDEVYQLKLKHSRAFYSEVEKKFGTMPFTLRSCDDEVRAKMGVTEAVKHKLIEPFNVLHEKEGEVVAQFKYTLLLLPSGGHKITGLPFEQDLFESEHKIEDESVLSLLQRSANPGKAKKKSKSKSGSSKATSAESNETSVTSNATTTTTGDENKEKNCTAENQVPNSTKSPAGDVKVSKDKTSDSTPTKSSADKKKSGSSSKKK